MAKTNKINRNFTVLCIKITCSLKTSDVVKG